MALEFFPRRNKHLFMIAVLQRQHNLSTSKEKGKQLSQRYFFVHVMSTEILSQFGAAGDMQVGQINRCSLQKPDN